MSGDAILHTRLPLDPAALTSLHRLPGTFVCAQADWLIRDEVFAQQMSYRERLITEHSDKVIAHPSTESGWLSPLIDMILSALDPHYIIGRDIITRPDGHQVARTNDLKMIGQLVQEDILILERDGSEHRLVGGILCFPASWTLSQKVGASLNRIHAPVSAYSDSMNDRVERMFHNLPMDRILARYNFLEYDSPELFHPLGEYETRPQGTRNYLRMERQTIRCIPGSEARVFAIHTYVVDKRKLPVDQVQLVNKIRADRNHLRQSHAS